MKKIKVTVFSDTSEAGLASKINNWLLDSGEPEYVDIKYQVLEKRNNSDNSRSLWYTALLVYSQ